MATATPGGKAEKVSKYETLKLLEKCRRERDEAIQREGALRDKLRHHESRSRSTEALKQKLKALAAENKEMRRQVKALRAEIGLETSPKFNGKTTKDVVSDLRDKERECSLLVEQTGRLSAAVDQLTSELASTVTAKTLLEEQVQALQQSLKDMTTNQRRLLKLWEDKKAQREQKEQLSLPAIPQRPGQRAVAHRAAQTEMSINPAQKLPANPRGQKARGLEDAWTGATAASTEKRRH
ncbi:uncharacterized protein LOC114787872 [Denticeps clupeoides]|uniref:uncharacterized protein LOC114787872 n=1 Tax=Denticeps clupeoides TaxID=299321 RepID=UPI0010A518F5|nr:uncharacterized protein LOC114787872 [Denticeps clupeoides]